MYLHVGEAYEEPGAVTSSGDEVMISGEVDVETPGIYDLTYSAVNKDGFEAFNSRRVYVSNTGDLVSSIEGLYVATVARVSPAETYEDIEYVRIWQVGENQYELSHALAGFYSIGRGYGDAYSATGAIITDNGDGSYTVEDAYLAGFDDVVSVTNFTVDPATKTITFKSLFSDYTFNITLEQFQF